MTHSRSSQTNILLLKSLYKSSWSNIHKFCLVYKSWKATHACPFITYSHCSMQLLWVQMNLSGHCLGNWIVSSQPQPKISIDYSILTKFFLTTQTHITLVLPCPHLPFQGKSYINQYICNVSIYVIDIIQTLTLTWSLKNFT